MKCPKCSSNNPILAKVCDACGFSPLAHEPADAEALLIAERMNDNLAALRAAAPPGTLGSFIFGFLILPTFGLAWVAQKAWQVFAHPKRSAGDAMLRLGQDVRAVETSYSADPSFKALAAQTRREMDERVSAVRLSMKQILMGVSAFALFVALAGGSIWISAARKSAAERALIAAAAAENERRAVAVLARLHDGAVEDAVALLKQISEGDVLAALPRHPALAIVQLAASGNYEAALNKASLISDPKARGTAETALAERALKALAGDYEHARAVTIAAKILPASRRAEALDAVIAAEARRMIDANRYQDAKALIGALDSPSMRGDLEARIKSRLE